MAKNSELKGAHFEIFQGFSSNFAKNVRFLYYREANKKRHVPLKVAPMCSKEHGFDHPASNSKLQLKGRRRMAQSQLRGSQANVN